YVPFIKACEQIAQLPVFDSNTVNNILKQHQLQVSASLPDLFTQDKSDLKEVMISLILELDSVQKDVSSSVNESELEAMKSARYKDLNALSISQLQEKLQQAWDKKGALLSIIDKIRLNKVLKNTSDHFIDSAFATSRLLQKIGQQVK